MREYEYIITEYLTLSLVYLIKLKMNTHIGLCINKRA